MELERRRVPDYISGPDPISGSGDEFSLSSTSAKQFETVLIGDDRLTSDDLDSDYANVVRQSSETAISGDIVQIPLSENEVNDLEAQTFLVERDDVEGVPITEMEREKEERGEEKGGERGEEEKREMGEWEREEEEGGRKGCDEEKKKKNKKKGEREVMKEKRKKVRKEKEVMVHDLDEFIAADKWMQTTIIGRVVRYLVKKGVCRKPSHKGWNWGTCIRSWENGDASKLFGEGRVRSMVRGFARTMEDDGDWDEEEDEDAEDDEEYDDDDDDDDDDEDDDDEEEEDDLFPVSSGLLPTPLLQGDTDNCAAYATYHYLTLLLNILSAFLGVTYRPFDVDYFIHVLDCNSLQLPSCHLLLDFFLKHGFYEPPVNNQKIRPIKFHYRTVYVFKDTPLNRLGKMMVRTLDLYGPLLVSHAVKKSAKEFEDYGHATMIHAWEPNPDGSYRFLTLDSDEVKRRGEGHFSDLSLIRKIHVVFLHF